MKLKTFLKPLDSKIKITIQEFGNGYLYAGDKSLTGGTEKNELFHKAILERKVKNYTFANGVLAIIVRKSETWYFSKEAYDKDMGFTTSNVINCDGLRIPKFTDNWYFDDKYKFNIHKDWCVKI